MVTGAGGSIGSELVRQILRQGPRRLVLFDAGEGPLYEIEREVAGVPAGEAPARCRRPAPPEIVAVLGSVLDSALVRRHHREQRRRDDLPRRRLQARADRRAQRGCRPAQQYLRHRGPGGGGASAAASSASCSISTDKAVRPTNIMGASKRLAEMVLQARAAERRAAPVFTMVRFGNVLDSSGSVVRMFRRQIEAGGPVTVTHPEVIRYFMSIPEAAALVIQAGAMATGGDVFVLDMGEPVKIDDLAGP